MSKEPSALAQAKAALKKAEADLGDPRGLVHLRRAVKSLLAMISGESPQIEKDIAKKLMVSCRTKVLSEAKLMLANFDSHEAATVQYWNDVMQVFDDAGLADDPDFTAFKARLLAKRSSQSVDSVKAAPGGVPTKEPQAACQKNDGSLTAIEQTRTMLHAMSLRAIGQSLAMLRLRAFRLKTTGDSYVVQSESLTEVHQWILRNYLAEKTGELSVRDQKSTDLTVGDGYLRYGPRDIARLNEGERKKGDDHTFEQAGDADQLAQLLRALGEHLDSISATVFEITWTPDAVAVDYQTPTGAREQQKFTVKKLHQLALYSRLRRSSRGPSLGRR
jgi:hypothetical protein